MIRHHVVSRGLPSNTGPSSTPTPNGKHVGSTWEARDRAGAGAIIERELSDEEQRAWVEAHVCPVCGVRRGPGWVCERDQLSA